MQLLSVPILPLTFMGHLLLLNKLYSKVLLHHWQLLRGPNEEFNMFLVYAYSMHYKYHLVKIGLHWLALPRMSLLPKFVLLNAFLTGLLGENDTSLFAALDKTLLGEVKTKLNLTRIITVQNVSKIKKYLDLSTLCIYFSHQDISTSIAKVKCTWPFLFSCKNIKKT